MVADFVIEASTLVINADFENLALLGSFDQSRVNRDRAGISGSIAVRLPGIYQNFRYNLLEDLVVGIEHQFTQRIFDGDWSGQLMLGSESNDAAFQQSLKIP